MRRIFLGFACNNGCVFCAQAGLRAAWKRDDGGRDVAAIEASIDALTDLAPGETVAFVGGEPTVHDELPRWISRAIERGASRVLVQTNGRRLAYAKYAEELAATTAGKSATLALDVSLQGSSREMHEHATRAPGSFAQTVLGLRHARGASIAAAVTTVITRANYRHLADIVRLAHASGASAIRFVPVEDVRPSAASGPPLAPPEAMMAPRLAAARDVARELKIALLNGDLAAGEGRFAGASVTVVPP